MAAIYKQSEFCKIPEISAESLIWWFQILGGEICVWTLIGANAKSLVWISEPACTMFGNTQVVAHMTLEQYEVLWVYITYNGKTLHVCIYLHVCVCVHVVSVSVFSFSIKSQSAQTKRKTEIY